MALRIMKVVKRDGTHEPFDYQKISGAIFKAAHELLSERDAKIVLELTLPKVLVVFKQYRRNVIPIEEIQDVVEEALMRSGYPQIARAYILYRTHHEDIRITKDKLGVKDELKLSLNAISVLKERYLLKNAERLLVETPSEMFRRVASHIAKAERAFSSKKEGFYRDKFYEKLTSLEFLPNSPTLMNAGTSLGQLSACFVLPIEDSIDGIFSSLRAMALIYQSGGGTGFSFSKLRPKNDLISSTKGLASGPVSFIQVFNAATNVIVQGGKRRGANMAVLRVDHPDIVEFIEAKLSEEALENFNISVGITDAFMRAVERNTDFSLINPRTKKVVRQIKAKTLLSLMTLCAYKYADPGLVFLDEINRANPLRAVGAIEATNPCGEIPLFPYESCNLGSINVARFVKNKKIDWGRLRETIFLAVRFLDNVIELNTYPLPEIEAMTKRNRKIGLGIMGFADMLIRLRIPYNSREAVHFAHQLMRYIRKASFEASLGLARERGVFPNWKHSTYGKKNVRIRNATLNSIAPTGSISIISGCSSGIEPIFALSFTRNVLEGAQLFELNPLLEEVIREEGIYSRKLMNYLKGETSLACMKHVPSFLKKLFVTAFDISALEHLNIQAAFQEFTDNAVSKTINLPEHATVEDVEAIYRKAYQLKLKGITVYRYGSKNRQVLVKGAPASGIGLANDYNGGCLKHSCPS